MPLKGALLGGGSLAKSRWSGVAASPVFPVAFTSGVAIALAHLAVSLEFGVTLTYHETFTRTVFLALYPLGLSFMGWGALLEGRLARRLPMPVLADAALRVAGASILVFLLLALRLNFLAASLGQLVFSGLLHLAALAAWFLALGAAVASLLRAAKQRGDAGWVGSAWTAHLAGLIVGYLLTEPLVHRVGPNAVLLAVGVSLLAASRGAPWVLAAALAAAPALSLDGRIEGFRDLGPLLRQEIQAVSEEPEQAWGNRVLSMHAGAQERIFRGWSRFGHVLLTRTQDRELRGFYNLVPQWTVQDPEGAKLPTALVWRSALYGVIQPGQRVLLLAAGGGRGLSCFRAPLHPGVTAVELNETVVRYLKDERPELNGGVFRRSTALAADGRFAVDTATAPFDAILVETGRFFSAQVLEPAGSPQGLHTREAVSRYLSRLRPGGLLIVLFDGVTERTWLEYLPLQVERSLSDAGAPTRLLAAEAEGANFLAIAASADPSVLDRLERGTARLERFGFRRFPWLPRSLQDPCHGIRLTDDHPFAHWHCMKGSRKRILLAAAALLAAVPLLLGLWAAGGRLRPRPAPGRSHVLFFFLIGAAHVALSIGTVYAFRSFFGDAVTTTIRLTIYALAYGAAGALCSHRLVGVGRRRLLAAAAVFLGLHAAGLALIPFGEGSAWAREAFAALMLAPGGLFMGALFPAAVLAVPEEDLDRCLLEDSLGAIAGYALFYLVLLPGGIRLFLAAGFALYAAALLLFPGARDPARY